MKRQFLLLTTVLLVWLSRARPQSAQGARTLSVSGHAGHINVVQLNGKSYVSIEDLTHLTQSSLLLKANQMVLTLAGTPATQPSKKQGFSRDFLMASIEQMGEVREWRIAIVNSIQNNSPVPEGWLSEQRRRAEKNLALASAARSTDDDHSAYPLLAAELSNMQKMSDRFLAKRKQLQYIDPKFIENDKLDKQILNCAHGLAAMAADEQFRDEPSCRPLS